MRGNSGKLLQKIIRWYHLVVDSAESLCAVTQFEGTVHLVIIYGLHAKIPVLEMKYNVGDLRNTVLVSYQ